MVNTSVDGTAESGKDCLLNYQKNITQKYKRLRIEENFILFYSVKDVCRYYVNAITFLDHGTMYGVSLIDLESNAVSQTLSAQFLPKYLTAYKDGFLFTSKHCIYFWKTSGMELFPG